MDDQDKKKREAAKLMNERARSAAASSSSPPVYDIIGARLRGYFDEVAKQPVPERFLELLQQLDAKTSPGKGRKI